MDGPGSGPAVFCGHLGCGLQQSFHGRILPAGRQTTVMPRGANATPSPEDAPVTTAARSSRRNISNGHSHSPNTMDNPAHVTLRVGVAVMAAAAGGWFPDRDAVADGDLLGSDEDVLDQQPQHSLPFADAGGGGAQLGEEPFQVIGEPEVGAPVGGLGVKRVELAAQAGDVQRKYLAIKGVIGCSTKSLSARDRHQLVGPLPAGAHAHSHSRSTKPNGAIRTLMNEVPEETAIHVTIHP